MIEGTLYEYLKSVLDENVYLEKPDPTTEIVPDKYVLIERTGGSKKNMLASSSFAIQSYAGSLYEAATLNDEVIQAMTNGAEGLNDIASVSLNSYYNFTDITTKQYRYQAIFNIKHY